MIAKSLLLFLLLIILPDIYLDWRYCRHRRPWWKRILRWLPGIGMLIYTIVLALEKNFLPDNPLSVHVYLLLFGLIVIPKAVYAICSLTGMAYCRLFHKKRNYGNLLGLLATPCIWYILIYGSFVGFQKLEVNRHTYTSEAVPNAFDGYRIALFSDAHVGSYAGDRQWILKQAIDSINALKPDMIVFTGDLQNIQPQELYQQMDILGSLRAPDGIFSVLGNHDYAEYIEGVDDAVKVANCRETISLERQLGWTLLLNEHRVIEKDKARLIIAGMENDGDGERAQSPQKGDIGKTLEGVGQSDFVIMLEHDPYSWRHRILPESNAQLTLSGHTHAMQFMIGNWSPMALTGKEWHGWYHEGQQSLFVTAGLGGVVPFRFGATGEVVLITLRKGS